MSQMITQKNSDKTIFLFNDVQPEKLFSLKEMARLGAIEYADLFFTEALLKAYQSEDENLAYLICHLSLCARKGHLCIQIKDNSLAPSMNTTWQWQDKSILKSIESKILSLDLTRFDKIISINSFDENKPIIFWNNSFYLQKFWTYETQFIESIKKIEKTDSFFSPTIEEIKSELIEAEKKKILLPQQARAIFQGCFKNLLIITGGPGTGKTYTAGYLVKTFLSALNLDEKEKCKIMITAPTGKAALNLYQSISNVLIKNQLSVKLEKKTLHSLLLNFNQQESLSFIQANFIIVDECSMIDAKMMSKLFSATKPGTKIILLGDKHQLPPIEAGSFFADLVQAKAERDNDSVVELQQCVRSDIQEIVSFSNSIKNENGDEILQKLKDTTQKRIVSYGFSEDSSVSYQQNKIIETILPFYQSISCLESPENLMTLFNQFRLLSPLKKGPYGTDAMNLLIYSKLSKESNVIPIIITQNDYKLNLFNGETGLLIKKRSFSKTIEKGDYALFPTHEGMISIPALLLRQYEYAYCMSIHKSQGCEFREIGILLPQGTENFGKELLYTAVTRAKKKIFIWGSDQIIQEIVKIDSKRISGIEQKFKDIDFN